MGGGEAWREDRSPVPREATPAAAEAWRAFEATRAATLATEQLNRLAVMIEHRPHGAR